MHVCIPVLTVISCRATGCSLSDQSDVTDHKCSCCVIYNRVAHAMGEMLSENIYAKNDTYN